MEKNKWKKNIILKTSFFVTFVTCKDHKCIHNSLAGLSGPIIVLQLNFFRAKQVSRFVSEEFINTNERIKISEYGLNSHFVMAGK